MRAATLLLLVLAAGPALTAAAAEPPLWGALSPGAATATDATQFLQALESGVGDITLTGAHCCLVPLPAARCEPCRPQNLQPLHFAPPQATSRSRPMFWRSFPSCPSS